MVDTAAKIQAVLDKGLEGRTVAATNMNAESSRSHSIFTIVVEMSSVEEETGREILRAGKLNLVDLAGSERQKKTGASGDTLKQGAMINLSLTSLGNVIQALTEAREHIPYRDSKLTRLLQDSLGGNTKTLMIAAISPADYNFDETMSTLRYANRAKNIKNKPKINEDPKDTLLRSYREEIERLKAQLEAFKNGSSGGNMDMGAINNMMAMLNGDAMNSNMITHDDDNNDNYYDDDGPNSTIRGPDEAARQTGGGAGGGGGGGGMNFAAFAGNGGTSNKSSPRGGGVSDLATIGEDGTPQKANNNMSPRLNKDSNPTPERLNGSGTGGGSSLSEKIRQDEHYSMLAVEHEYVRGELKERDEEIELEKQRVAQMASKLQELENQLMANMHAHSFFGDTAAAAAGGGTAAGGGALSGVSHRVVQESAEEQAEREAAKKAYEARRAALKAKKDAKKVKARNEKQEHEREKEFLLDSLREQSRNLQEETQERMLYEQIVHALLAPKDIKRLLDKCRWNEHEHYWSLPALKQKSASDTFALPDINKPNNNGSNIDDHYSPRGGGVGSGGSGGHSSNSNNNNSNNNSYGVSTSIDNSGLFSSGKGSGNSSGNGSGSRVGTGNRNNFAISPRISDQLTAPSCSYNNSANPSAPYSSIPPLESQTPRSRIHSGRKVKDKSRSEHNVLPSATSGGGSGGGGYGSGAGVANNGSNSNSSPNPNPNGNSDGEADYNYSVDLPPSSKPPKDKNKSKGKKRKQKKGAQAGGSNGGAQDGEDQEYSDWGFNGNGVPQAGGDEPAYSDDEDFDEDENGFQNHDHLGDQGPSEGDAPLSFSQFAQCQPMNNMMGAGEEGNISNPIVGKKKNKKIKEDNGISPVVSPRAPQLFPSLK